MMYKKREGLERLTECTGVDEVEGVKIFLDIMYGGPDAYAPWFRRDDPHHKHRQSRRSPGKKT